MGFDGYVVLAILTLFFVYFLPSLIRSAQVVAEARIEDRFSTDLHIIATAGRREEREHTQNRTFIHPPRQLEHSMNTPVAHKLAAADARRVAAARAARAAASSRRAAAAKRRMLLLSVMGAVSISAWVLTAMVSFPWVVSVLLTAATIGVVELGRRAALAGVKADAELARRVEEAQNRAKLPTRVVEAAPAVIPVEETVEESAETSAQEEGTSSLRVSVDPEIVQEFTWTPVPVPPPAYTLKAQVRRKAAEPYVAEEQAAVPVAASTGPVVAEEETTAPQTASINVQEILARRRAVG